MSSHLDKFQTEEPEISPELKLTLTLAALTFLAGTALALGVLVSQPVATLPKSTNSEPFDAGKVYWIRGDRSSFPAWEKQLKDWETGATVAVRLSEGDLNHWAEQHLKVDRQQSTEDEPARPSSRFSLQVDPVNFRLADGEVFVSGLLRISGLTGQRTFLYQLRGQMVETRFGVRFETRSAHLGQAPIGRIPLLGSLFQKQVIRSIQSSAGYQWFYEQWENFRHVEQVDGVLTLYRERSQSPQS